MNKVIAALALTFAIAAAGCSRSDSEAKPEETDAKAQTGIPSSEANSAAILISTVPFSHTVVLKPGDTYTFKLPNGKTIAVWCEKYSEIMSSMFDSDIDLCYGEKPFQKLEYERIKLRNGGYTFGELISYIRADCTIQSGDEFTYILYVKEYRISLMKKGADDKRIPLIVSVRRATDMEQISAKEEVGFYIKRLGDSDSEVQLEAIEKLRELMDMCSTYADLRREEIHDAIRPLSLSKNSKVRSAAEETLITSGDVKSIMQAILPKPKSRWRTEQAAKTLATYSRILGREKIYEKVLPFLESKDLHLFYFAADFFSEIDYKPVYAYLERAAKSDQADIKAYASRMLGNRKMRDDPREMARAIARRLDDPDRGVIRKALMEASRYNNLIPPEQICKHLTSEDEEIRHLAAYALDCCQNPKVIAPLLKTTEDRVAKVRAQAAVSLGRIAAPSAYPRLIELMKDEDAEVRESAINGLRWLGNSKAIPEIEAILKGEPDKDVQNMAKRTIRELSRR